MWCSVSVQSRAGEALVVFVDGGRMGGAQAHGWMAPSVGWRYADTDAPA